MSSEFMNALAVNGEYRANCFDSSNNYERLWKGVRAYKWNQVVSSSSTSLDGVTSYGTSWASHHWGLLSGSNEKDALLTSHSGNEWACAGNQGPGGEGAALSLLACIQSYVVDCSPYHSFSFDLFHPGYTGRGGRSNMRICEFHRSCTDH